MFKEEEVINGLHTDKAIIGRLYYCAQTEVGLKSIVDHEKRGYVFQLENISTSNEYSPFKVLKPDSFVDARYFSLVYPFNEGNKRVQPFGFEDCNSFRDKWVMPIFEKDGAIQKIVGYNQTGVWLSISGYTPYEKLMASYQFAYGNKNDCCKVVE